MTPFEAGAVLSRRAQTAPGRQAGRHAAFDPGPVWMRVLPPAVMLAMALWRITGASYWRDEAATLTAVQRPFADLLRMMRHVDAVHGSYYMLLWVVVRLGGTGEFVTRLPSALAMAGAAAAVAALGRRLVSPRAGLAAGMIFAVLPQISLYAQDAREYAMITALAATGSYLLVRAMTATGARWGWLAWYAFCLGVMGALNVLSLLLVAAHAVTVALACWRADDRKAAASLAAGWLAAAAAAVMLAGPVLALGFAQRGTLGWLSAPDLIGAVEGLRRLIGPPQMLLAVCLTVALAALLTALAGRPAVRACWPPELFELCLPWLVLPPGVLIGISYVSPVYTFRYVLFCAPAAALLAGAGLAALSYSAGSAPAWVPAWVPAAAFAAIAVLGVPAQLTARAPNGHGNNIREANAIVAAERHPGDAVWYLRTGAKYFPAAYPSGFGKLDDIAQKQTPSQAGNLTGTRLRARVVRQRLARVRRVWVVKLGPYPHNPLHGLNFRLVRTWRTSDIWLLLFVRRHVG